VNPFLAGLAGAAVGAAVGAGTVALWARSRSRKTRRELEEARRRMAKARAGRERFFDVTTHELRAPLAAILGYQELLHDGVYGELSDAARDATARLGRAARHLLHLVDGVIELSRIRSGDVHPDLDAVDLGVLFAAAADAFRGHGAEREIEVTIEIPADLPTVRTDRDRLVQAVDLIVTSAVRHPAGPHMTLRVEADEGTVSVTLEPTHIALDTDTEDPTIRMGIRLAVAHRIGQLLGGGLDLPVRDGHARAIHFRFRDQPPAR
jgi:signal transduction histidine kinase